MSTYELTLPGVNLKRCVVRGGVSSALERVGKGWIRKEIIRRPNHGVRQGLVVVLGFVRTAEAFGTACHRPGPDFLALRILEMDDQRELRVVRARLGHEVLTNLPAQSQVAGSVNDVEPPAVQRLLEMVRDERRNVARGGDGKHPVGIFVVLRDQRGIAARIDQWVDAQSGRYHRPTQIERPQGPQGVGRFPYQRYVFEQFGGGRRPTDSEQQSRAENRENAVRHRYLPGSFLEFAPDFAGHSRTNPVPRAAPGAAAPAAPASASAASATGAGEPP